MIKATVQQCCEGYIALRALGEARMPAKTSWRITRLISRLKPVMKDFEETQLKVFLEHGAVPSGNQVNINAPEKGEKTDAEFQQAMEDHKANIAEVQKKMDAIHAEVVEVDYDPIPINLFADAMVSATALADAGPFISE